MCVCVYERERIKRLYYTLYLVKPKPLPRVPLHIWFRVRMGPKQHLPEIWKAGGKQEP